MSTWEAHIVVTIDADDEDQAQERIDEIFDLSGFPDLYGLAFMDNRVYGSDEDEEDEEDN